MENIKTTIKGNKLIIEVDLSKEYGLSASGKSVSVASTKGNKAVADGIMMGINIYKPVKAGVRQ